MSNRELTKEVVLEMFNTRGMNMKVAENFVNELTAKGYLAPEPEEPRNLTHIEAAAVIGRGGKVRSNTGKEYPSRDNHITLNKDFEPYTKVEETIEIDTEVWVNVYPKEMAACFHSSKEEADEQSYGERIACEKFHLHRVIKKGE